MKPPDIPADILRALERDDPSLLGQDASISSAKPVPFRIESLPNIWTLRPQSAEWTIESLIPSGAITLLCGDSGVGKSTLAIALAGAVAHGQMILGRVARKRHVLYVDRENPDYVVQQRIKRLGIPEASNLFVWGQWVQEQPGGPLSAEIIRFVREHTPFLIFDSLVAFHPGSEQDATETRRFLQGFRTLAAAGASVLLLHHTGKAEGARQYRGSSDIKAAVDVAFLMESLNETESGIQSLRIKTFKNRLAPPENFSVEYRDDRFEISDHRVQTNREILERIIGDHPGVSKTEIESLASAAGIAQKRTRTLLEEGVRAGWLLVETGVRNKQSYRLAPTEVGEL